MGYVRSGVVVVAVVVVVVVVVVVAVVVVVVFCDSYCGLHTLPLIGHPEQ